MTEKEKKKQFCLDLRLKRAAPDWLRELPKGDYNVKQLQSITGKSISTIKQRFTLLDTPRRYCATTGYPLVVYMWEGIESYEAKKSPEVRKEEVAVEEFEEIEIEEEIMKENIIEIEEPIKEPTIEPSPFEKQLIQAKKSIKKNPFGE